MRPNVGSSPRAGISLFAVIVVLALVALIAGLAIPGFFGQGEVTLENACVLLVRDIHTAQNRAIWSGVDTYLEFDQDGGGYRIVDRAGRMVEQLGALGDMAQRYEEGGVFDGVHIVRVDCGPNRSLAFDAKKRAWSSGEVELSFHGETRVVRVLPKTGEVRILGLKRPWKSSGE